MNNNFKTTIGIEIHIQLNTKSKMFSSSPNDFNSSPNTNISIIDIGYPGTLPTVNKEAIIKAIKLAKALNMEIDNELHFDRKHYFYPDLPKGFQITQYFRPIGENGEIIISKNKKIKIERIHLEEDTAKILYDKNNILLDYNRSGIPLIEIVSYPIIESVEDAINYIEAIRQLVSFLDISDAKMEEGSLRADLNISIRQNNQKKLGKKVEIKNVNSISNAKKAIEIEIELQKKDILNGFKIQQTTKRFDDKNNKNIIMRIKKESADYKYFPEPNIPPIFLPKNFLNSIKIKSLPWIIAKEYKKLNFNDDIINQIIKDKDKLNFLEQINYEDKAKATKIFFAEIVSIANKKQMSVKNLNIKPSEIKYILQKEKNGEISGTHIKKIIPLLVNNKIAANIIKEKKFKQVSNEFKINKMISFIINNNESFIKKNKEKTQKIFKFILGQIMKISKGQVNPQIASKLVKTRLDINV